MDELAAGQLAALARRSRHPGLAGRLPRIAELLDAEGLRHVPSAGDDAPAFTVSRLGIEPHIDRAVHLDDGVLAA